MKPNADSLTVFLRLLKLRNKIKKLCTGHASKSISHQDRKSIIKRYDRCLKKLIAVDHPISKAVSIIGLSLLFSLDSNAQCDSFVNAEISNPLKTASLRFQ